MILKILKCLTIFTVIVFSKSVASSPFLQQTADYITVNNRHAVLKIIKYPWKIELLDEKARVQYSEARAPAFRIDDQWQALDAVDAVKEIPSQTIIISAHLQNKHRAEIIIKTSGEYGFQIKMTAKNAPVSSIRGITKLFPVEEIYGFGETWNGHVAQRGQVIDVWDRNGTPDECAYMPYYVSTQNYAFFLNYGGRVHFDVGQTNALELSYEAPAKFFDITLISAESVAGAVEKFVQQFGLPAKPPRWSFKPWFWLMADPDRPGSSITTLRGHHFVDMVNRLQKMNIPVSVVWFEPPWQTARTSFIPNKNFSPDLKGVIQQLADMGVRSLAWTVPYTTKDSPNWQEAVQKGYLVQKPCGVKEKGNVRITGSGEVSGKYYNYIDFYNPEAFAWWQRKIEKALDLGLKGFKLDAGQSLQPDAILYGGRIGKDVHNSYALQYNKVFYETLRKRYGDDFLMIPRAAWVGSASYTNSKWPGDLSGSFARNGLPSSVYSSLSLSLSGMPFYSTDMGGFQDKPAPERPWVRWAEFGAMLPGMQTLHMPWWYSQKAQKHFRYLAWLHTELTPYWNSLANVAHRKGTPICRPLVWTFQKDQNTWRVDDEFTVGPWILVAPIIDPNPRRDVYLPDGRWYDFWDDSEVFSGKQTIRWFKGWQESQWKFPLYIREGAIIPMEIENDVTGLGWAQCKGYVTMAIWPKPQGESRFVLRDRGEQVQFKVVQDSREIKIARTTSGMKYLFRIHWSDMQGPLKIEAAVGKRRKFLKAFENLSDFTESVEDGWILDAKKKKLWIRIIQKDELALKIVKIDEK